MALNITLEPSRLHSVKDGSMLAVRTLKLCMMYGKNKLHYLPSARKNSFILQNGNCL